MLGVRCPPAPHQRGPWVQTDHIICDDQCFRPKTHVIYHSNNDIRRVAIRWHDMDDVKLKIRPRQTLMSSIGKFPQRRKIEGQVQILVKRLLTQEKVQIVIWCVLFALDKAMELGATGLIINYIQGRRTRGARALLESGIYRVKFLKISKMSFFLLFRPP